jgi:hypothetical protein
MLSTGLPACRADTLNVSVICDAAIHHREFGCGLILGAAPRIVNRLGQFTKVFSFSGAPVPSPEDGGRVGWGHA